MMQHRAFLFDYARFTAELEPMLDEALRTGHLKRLARHLDEVEAELSDPEEGEPFEGGWRTWLESGDVHELGDIALTRFYDPGDDLGLGDDWLGARDALVSRLDTTFPVLGRFIGPADRPFDPGRMGSYVQSPSDVVASLAVVEAAVSDGIVALASLTSLLGAAVRAGAGLYVTF